MYLYSLQVAVFYLFGKSFHYSRRLRGGVIHSNDPSALQTLGKFFGRYEFFAVELFKVFHL